MECSNIQEKLSAYIEGVISSEEKVLIEEHIGSCQKCSESLADLRKTIEYVKNLEEIEPPSWMTQKVMARVRSEVKPKKGILQKLFYPLHIKLPIEAAATILIAVTAIYIFKTIQLEMRLETPKEIAKIPSERVTPQILPSHPPVPTKPVEQPILEKEQKITADKSLEAHKTPEIPARQDKVMPFAGALVKEKTRRETPPTAAKTKALAERKREGISLIIDVKDIETDSKEIEKALIQCGGKIIKTESFENKDVLTAELDSTKLKELIGKLKLIGEIEEKEPALEALEGDIEIRIEIVKKPMQRY